MSPFRVWRHFDYVLLAVTILLTIYGVVMIYSATLGSPDPNLQGIWRRQAMFGAVGVGIILLLTVFPPDYQWFGDFWWLAYLLAVALLVLVLLFGESEIGEVSRWLDLGFTRFQPSFLAMNLLAISVGAVLSRRHRRRRGRASSMLFGAPKTSLLAEEVPERPGWINYVASILMTLVLVALVFLQPDMSTAGVLAIIWLAMLFESGMPLHFLVLTGLLGLGSLVPLWDVMARFPYMRDRVWGFINPGSDPNIAYQLNQAAIAIGSGGLLGKGLAQGTQSQLRYLPVRHTDFIFSVLAEELGFAGVMLLFALYLVLFFRLLRIIINTQDVYGRMLVIGALAMILFPLIVNVGMNLGMFPISGLPLPFITYGNSALLTAMIGIGIAENVAVRRRKLEFQAG
jgi:rod shape determining protein RodA